jgi:hypothetical protein
MKFHAIEFQANKLRAASLGLLCLFFFYVSTAGALALDREAFTFTKYDLSLQIDPEQHRLGARGKITLRNDSQTPQKIAVLQISSSLDWRSIKSGDKAVQFVRQPYTSDIDHTGALSEAIVTLREEVPPKGTVELDIAYEGVILLDTTRLVRVDAPEDSAGSIDWDQISTTFTGVRGAGYVAWYPIATEVANLSEGNSLFEVVARWKAREEQSAMEISVASPDLPDYATVPTVSCGGDETRVVIRGGSPKWPVTKCSYAVLGLSVPTLVIADYQVLERSAIEVRFLHGHDAAAKYFADEAEKAAPLIDDWFGKQREKGKTYELPDAADAPFENRALLLTALPSVNSKLAGLAAAHQLTHASFLSFRPWIEEGLAHFAQALYLEHEKSRQAALDYMELHRGAFSEAENQTSVPRSEDEVNRSLVNTGSEELYPSKAMYVWWMLREMIGDAALKKALASYRAEQDNDPTYMQRLIAAQTQRDLQWFFDDWVYHDRGLPDFKIETAFSRKTTQNTFLVTITVDNLGRAGAEVPVTARSAKGEVTQRIEVRAKSKGVFRVELQGEPQEIVVNDGSVAESDMTNNVFKVAATGK